MQQTQNYIVWLYIFFYWIEGKYYYMNFIIIFFLIIMMTMTMMIELSLISEIRWQQHEWNEMKKLIIIIIISFFYLHLFISPEFIIIITIFFFSLSLFSSIFCSVTNIIVIIMMRIEIIYWFFMTWFGLISTYWFVTDSFKYSKSLLQTASNILLYLI